MLCRLTWGLVLGSVVWVSTSPAQGPGVTAYAANPGRVPTPDFSGLTVEQAEQKNATAANGHPLFRAVTPKGKAGGVVGSQWPVQGTPEYPGELTLQITLRAAEGAKTSLLTT